VLWGYKMTRPKKKISWVQVEIFAKVLTNQLKVERLKIENIYPVGRGGMIPAVMLSHLLDLPVTLKKSAISNHTIVIDEIVDTGRTMQEFRTMYPRAWRVALMESSKLEICDYYGSKYDNNDYILFPWEVE